MLRAFLRYLDNDSGLRQETVNNYSRVGKYLHEQGALMGKEDFEDFKAKRKQEGASPETVRKYVKVVKQWCKCFKLEWGELIKYPPKIRHKLPAPPFDTIMEFLEVDTGEMWNMYWLLHVNCGTRPGEVAKLSVEDIDIEQRCFYPKETKTNDNSAIIIFDWLIDDVRKYCHKIGSGYLFSSKYSHGGPVSLKAVEKDCYKRLKLINCQTKYTPHSFRRAFATIAHLRGQMPLVMVQRLLRHTNIATTEGYISGDADYVREAANMHPYNHAHCDGDMIIAEIETYVRKKLKDKLRFDQNKVREALNMLYLAAK